MEKVAYKQFYIIVRVNPDELAKDRFQVFCEIRPVQNETQLLRACAIVAEFANEKAAYERGLLQCKGWIDQREQDG